MDIQILNFDQIRRSAEHAADHYLGPRVNPHPEDTPAFKEWLHAYYLRVKLNAEEVAA